jgi:hypothetical protein
MQRHTQNPAPQILQHVTMTELLSAFFVTGMHQHEVDDVLVRWDNGYVELVLDLCTYTRPLANMMTAAILCVGDNVGGQFLSEVAEPFGSWFTEVVKRTGRAPARARALSKLQDLVVAFYSQTENCDTRRLTAAVGSAQGLRVVH